MAKDTIYIDAEDEITAIIEKVRSSESSIVALVLPKRSQTLQSIVNLKLLKRTADDAKKNIVLITSDQNLLPIAGAVGLHVAKTPQSKPAVPESSNSLAGPENLDVLATNPSDKIIDPATPIGLLASEDTIDLGNDKVVSPIVDGTKKVKKRFNNKLKVPNFDRFRLILLGGIGLILFLIVGGVFALVILPKANIVIKTDTTSVKTELTLTANAKVTELNKETNVVPAVKKELKKTENEKSLTTGQRDEGTKAKGSVKFTLKDCSKSEVVIASGSTISASDLNYITQSDVVLKRVLIGNDCHNADFEDLTTATVGVVAQLAGDKYNVGATAYSVAGANNVSAAGSKMIGGTSKIVKIVAQADIDNAKTKLLEKLSLQASNELKTSLKADNLLALEDTYSASEPISSSSPNVNDEASEVTVSVTINYSELGVKKDDLKQLIEQNVNKQIDSSKQSIQDDGLENAVIRVLNKNSADEVSFSITSVTIAGPQLDAEGIKKDIAGKKKGATVKAIEERPGIKSVDVNYSPFWVFSTPKRTSHININFDQGND